MSPHRDWMGRRFSTAREWENTAAVPFSDVSDVTRGELRLAAEVALAELHALAVPTFAHERAVDSLKVMAFG